MTDVEIGIRCTDSPRAADRAPIAVVADNIRSAFNVGGLFRTAEFFGAERLVLCGYTPAPDSPQVAKTALGAADALPWERVPDVRDAIAKRFPVLSTSMTFTATRTRRSPCLRRRCCPTSRSLCRTCR